MGAERKGQSEHDGNAAPPTGTGTATGGRRTSRSRAATGYSGRILVRMPSELHEQLAQAAEREEVSLNRYVNDALSNSVEAVSSPRPEISEGAAESEDRAPQPGRPSAPALRFALATNLAIVVVAAVLAVVLLVLALQRGI